MTADALLATVLAAERDSTSTEGGPRYQRPVFNIHIVFRATAANGHMLTQISIKLKAKVAELVVEEAEEEEYLDVEFF